MQNFSYSQSGLKLTEHFEGVRLEAYQDVRGVWTIGYGHTGPDVYPGLKITQTVAEALLISDVHKAESCVNQCVTVTITQNEFDALVDFTFNDGTVAFARSTLLKRLNSGDYAGAAGQFALWVNAGGHKISNLVIRRQAEHDLFVR
jgi:lysozyme